MYPMREIERRVSVYEEAPGFRLGPRALYPITQETRVQIEFPTGAGALEPGARRAGLRPEGADEAVQDNDDREEEEGVVLDLVMRGGARRAGTSQFKGVWWAGASYTRPLFSST
jgi:hypothetical protein